MRNSLRVVSRIARVSFDLICGGNGELKKKAGTSRDQDSSSVPVMGRISGRSSRNHLPTQCVFCLFVRAEAKEAITVMNGQAVCFDHTYYVQGGDFARILAVVKRDELRQRG